MKAKEYRDRNNITSSNFWNGDEIDFNMIYEFAEDYAVSERENILTKYHRYLQDNLCLDLNVIWVKEFLKEREYYDGFRNKL